MSYPSEQKPEVKPPAEIKRETLEVANNRNYTMCVHCIPAKIINMELVSLMLKKNPDYILLCNCPRDFTDDSEVDTRNYQIRYNGDLVSIFVHNDIPIVGCGPFPGEKRKTLETSDVVEKPDQKEVAKCEDVPDFYVDVQLKLRSGQPQTHRIVAIYHPHDRDIKNCSCRWPVALPEEEKEKNRPRLHIFHWHPSKLNRKYVEDVEDEGKEEKEKMTEDDDEGEEENEKGSVAVVRIKPVEETSTTSTQTSEQPSTSVEVKEEVYPGVEGITTGVKETL